MIVFPIVTVFAVSYIEHRDNARARDYEHQLLIHAMERVQDVIKAQNANIKALRREIKED